MLERVRSKSIVGIAAAFLGVSAVPAAQVVTMGSPFLTGCSQEAAPALSPLGEPGVGNQGFGVLIDSVYFDSAPGHYWILFLGVCAPTPVPISSFNIQSCPAMPGGCFVYLDLVNPVVAVSTVYAIQPAFPIGGTTSAARAAVSLPIPAVPAAVGANICAQFINRTSSSSCVRVSNGLSITVIP